MILKCRLRNLILEIETQEPLTEADAYGDPITHTISIRKGTKEEFDELDKLKSKQTFDQVAEFADQFRGVIQGWRAVKR